MFVLHVCHICCCYNAMVTSHRVVLVCGKILVSYIFQADFSRWKSRIFYLFHFICSFYQKLHYLFELVLLCPLGLLLMLLLFFSARAHATKWDFF